MVDVCFSVKVVMSSYFQGINLIFNQSLLQPNPLFVVMYRYLSEINLFINDLQ